jgi:LuxR family maltose regulon positive regulatory protein
VHWGLGASLARNGQFDDSADTLNRLWTAKDRDTWPPWLVLSVAGTFVMALLQAERLDECDAALRTVETLANDVEEAAGRAITPGVSALRLAAGRRAYQRGSAGDAAVQLRHAVELVQLHPRPTLLVLALAYLAEAELAVGDRGAAQACLRRARDITDEEPVSAFVFARLEAVETRMGRGAVRAARQSGSMVEELTDRELSILRMLQGTATQREIAAAMFLSVNTVKSYNKSLYRKLGVASRAEAVLTARELGLI